MAGTSAGLAIQVAFLVVLGVGGARVDSGAISVATLVAFLLYVMYLTQPVLQLVNAGTYFQAGRAAIGRIGEVTRLATRTSTPTGPPRPCATTVPGADGELAAADPAALASRTSRSPTPAARRPPSRASRSTSAPAGSPRWSAPPAPEEHRLRADRALLRPRLGPCSLDGRDLRDWGSRPAGHIGYVEQGAPVMSGTLRENLVIAAPGASERSCRRARASPGSRATRAPPRDLDTESRTAACRCRAASASAWPSPARCCATRG